MMQCGVEMATPSTAIEFALSSHVLPPAEVAKGGSLLDLAALATGLKAINYLFQAFHQLALGR